MQRPSITFVNRIYPPQRGATGRVLKDLASKMAQEGWRVTIITTGEKAERSRDGALRIIRVKGAAKPQSLFGYIFIWIKLLLTALREPAPHVLSTLTDPPLLAVAGNIIAKRKGCKHIHWCHDLYPDLLPIIGAQIPQPLVNAAYKASRRALKHADRVIVVGRCMGRLLVHEGIDPRRITFIPNWTDLELTDTGITEKPKDFHTFSNDVEAAKPHEDQIKATPKFRILYAGNLGRAHPIDTVIQTASILQQDQDPVEFVFVGEGPRYEALAQIRAQANLDNIRLVPYQPGERLSEILEGGDLHLVSMAQKAAGMLVPCKSYAALVTPRPLLFLGPAGCEIAKLIEEFKAGSVLNHDDPQALVKTIRRYVRESEYWETARQGAENAGQIYRPQSSIEAWIQRAWTLINATESTVQDA